MTRHLAIFLSLAPNERLKVWYGPEYPSAVVYASPGAGQSFICFEPMSDITSAFNGSAW